jgi:hypothetical protein
VGVTAGSREVPGRKPVTRDNNDDDDDNNNNNNNNNLSTIGFFGFMCPQCLVRVHPEKC